MKKNRLSLTSIVLLFTLLIPLSSGCSKATEERAEISEIPEVNPYRGDTSAIAEGKRLFGVKCSQCHGPDAAGGPEAPDLTDEETLYGTADDELFMIVYYGTPNGMPTWKDELGEENIWKVVAYLESVRK